MLQVKKEEDALNRGFGTGRDISVLLSKLPTKEGEVKMTTVMLFGNAKECEDAVRLIEEAIDNKEQKQKQRQKEYDRKRDQKLRDRQLYHLRHTHDYEMLEVPVGTSKADCRRAFRQLAKLWHPDKHPDNQEEAKARFQAIQRAYESLMSTDEDTKIEALAN